MPALCCKWRSFRMTLLSQAQPNLLVVHAPDGVEAGILRALLYADVFDYPLTPSEIHRYLECEQFGLAQIEELLGSSVWLRDQITQSGEFYMLRGREALRQSRLDRARVSSQLWGAARHYGRLLAHLPFVRLVAVTGALAVDNAHAGDDIDYLIVTTPGRVWLARAGAILIVRLARLFAIQLCPNYVLATSALRQDRQDLFVAHELAQMTPLAGRDVYWQMRSANAWAADLLPNAITLPRCEPDLSPGRWGKAIQQGLEWLLGGELANRLEHWEQRRKTQRFQGQLHKPGSAARLDAQRVQGHFNDYGHKALSAYRQRCGTYRVG